VTFSIRALPGFNPMLINWGGPDEPRTDQCSYCGDKFPDEEDDPGFVPLILWNSQGCHAAEGCVVKALTIWQPWASLIMIGAKPYEFRGRSYFAYAGHPNPGERIVIHAGTRPVKREEVHDLLVRLCTEEIVDVMEQHGAEFLPGKTPPAFFRPPTGLVPDCARDLLNRVYAAHQCRLLPLGAGLGTAVIGEPRNAGEIVFGDKIPEDSDRGEFNWAWPLSDVVPFDAPIPARGMQGFWEWRP
jgi:hypothetical protein